MTTIRTLILTIAMAVCAAAPAHASLRVTVQPGDSLAAIGDRHGVSPQAIASANGIHNPAMIAVGTSLWIPSGGSSAGVTSSSTRTTSSGGGYTVQPGENLGAIAARHGTTADALARANGITNPHAIVAGTTIRISGASSSSTTTTAVSTSRTSSGGGYTVQPGENLGAIAARHGTTADALARANGIANPDSIVAGTTIRISGASSASTRTTVTTSSSSSGGGYTVQPGENLSAIAARHGTTADALARANGIANPDAIVAGTTIRISGTASSATTRTTAVTASSSSGGGYTVQPGENLGAIAARHGTTADALARANGISNPNMIVAGTTIRISGAASSATARTTAVTTSTSSSGGYTVQPGENLGAIAARHGTTADALARANGISNPDMIVAGTTIRISGASTTSTSTTTTSSTGSAVPVTAATSGWGGHPGSSEVRGYIDEAAARHGVDPALLRAIAWQESGYWQGARSSVGAIGVMQLMPTTASWAGPALLGRSIDPTNVRDNIDTGAAYVAYLQRNTSSRDQAVASCYQGMGSVTSRGLYDDTKQYVASVNGHYGNR